MKADEVPNHEHSNQPSDMIGGCGVSMYVGFNVNIKMVSIFLAKYHDFNSSIAKNSASIHTF